MKTNTINIRFDVHGSINQEILLDEPMEKEDFLSKVKSGDILTTIGHSPDNNDHIYDLSAGFKCIGRVVHQTTEDAEFYDYALEDEEEEV